MSIQILTLIYFLFIISNLVLSQTLNIGSKMQNLLPASHPSLALSAPLKEYCDRFLKKYNLNYFQIIRVNSDGSTAILTNQPEYIQFAYGYSTKVDTSFIFSCLKKEVLNPALYYFLWEPNLPSLPVSLAREFNICNGLTFVERYPTHYYMFGFAAPHTNHGILDFYINNVELLQDFIQNFKEEQKNLLLTLESNPIILPATQIDANLKSMLLKKNGYKIPVNIGNRSSYITSKEYECLQKLKMGYTAKEIGRGLKISPRTVEEYFLRIKNRTGCSKKPDLINLI